jgi:hypothetical protein
MCQWNVGTLLPRDVMQITPCFRHSDIGGLLDGPGYQTLAEDLATGLQAKAGTTRGLTVKLYEIGLPKPNRPKATAVRNAGLSAESTQPRELAMCLSFYGDRNAPHQRGRLYVPLGVLTAAGALSVRPAAGLRDNLGTWADIFSGLGGANVDWIVWSPTRQEATKVDHWFVDDEYDVQRRRGYKPSARSAGTTSG